MKKLLSLVLPALLFLVICFLPVASGRSGIILKMLAGGFAYGISLLTLLPREEEGEVKNNVLIAGTTAATITGAICCFLVLMVLI